MVLLRPFREEDNATLLEIEKLCPQGNDKIAEAMDKSPDAIARYRLYDNWDVLVAEEDDRVVGWTGWTLKQNTDGEKYGYITEVIVHPEFQRRGIATELIKKAETNLKENGALHAYCYVFEANGASNAMFVKNEYIDVGKMQIQAISVYKEAKVTPGFSIRHAAKADIEDIVNLINSYYAGNSHFVPYTAESFETHINNIPGYGLDKFWIASSDDRIIACAGLWDISALAKMYYAKEPASMRFLGLVFNFLDRFTNMPKIPAENELFVTTFITDYAFTPQGSDAMSNIIKYLNNIIFESQRYFIVAPLTTDDPIVQIIKDLHNIEWVI
jgi:ribosomal protein S18 acetylase RimI-like enzyme